MIRNGIPLRLALMAGLFAPALARAQEVKSADPPAGVAANPGYQAAAKAAAEAEAAAKLAGEKALKAQAARVEAFHQATGQKPATPARPQAPTSNQFFNPTQTRVYTPRTNRTASVRLVAMDSLEATFGLALADADDALRAQLAIPSGEGVVVVTAKPEGLAGQAGLKPNDVVIVLGDEPAKSAAQAKAKILAIGKGALPLKLIRAGKPNQLSLVGPGHGTPDEVADYWLGVPVTPVDATLRSHIQGLPPETGLVANDVVADSPAGKAGVKKFDILISLGKKPLKGSAGLIEAVQATQGKPTTLEIARAGQMMNLEVTPVRREAAKFTSVVFSPENYQWAEAIKQLSAATGADPKSLGTTFDIARFQPLAYQAVAAPDPSKVEGMLAELKGMIEDLQKKVEAIKKPDGK